MPSKRPARAMDEAAAAAARLDAASPLPRSRSSSRSKSRARDRRRSANPNPSSRKRSGPEGSPASAAPPSRKSVRKPKPRAFPDSATLATAAAAASAAASSSAAGLPGGKLWSDADEVALLTGAAAFKERSGVAPRAQDMPDLYEFLKDSIAPHLDQDKVYYKLKRLKSKFQHTVPGATSTPHDRLVRDLSADLWGAELARPVEGAGLQVVDAALQIEDVADVEEAQRMNANRERTSGDLDEPVRLPIVREVLGEYWKLNGQALSGVSLEKGLDLLGLEEATVVEGKWRRQLEADMRMQMRRHDLGKEVYGLLIDAIKGLGP